MSFQCSRRVRNVSKPPSWTAEKTAMHPQTSGHGGGWSQRAPSPLPVTSLSAGLEANIYPAATKCQHLEARSIFLEANRHCLCRCCHYTQTPNRESESKSKPQTELK